MWPYSADLARRRSASCVRFLVAVDRADGVVGRVDDDGRGLGRDGGLDRVDVEHEVACARGYLDGYRAGVACPGLVLGEVRRDGDELLARQDDGLDGYADGGRGTGREVEVAGRVVRAIAAVEVLRDGLAGLDEAGRHGIDVHGALALAHEALDVSSTMAGRVRSGCRSRDRRSCRRRAGPCARGRRRISRESCWVRHPGRTISSLIMRAPFAGGAGQTGYVTV